jgi:SAM-dependent methyltransferase
MRPLLESYLGAPMTDPRVFDKLCGELFIRMATSEATFVPWLKQHVPLDGATVVEIGAGSGSSTVPYAPLVRSVTAVDIDPTEAEHARERHRLLGVDNVRVEVLPGDWLEPGSTFDYGTLIAPADMVICYALLEHLKIDERLQMLRECWQHLRPGGYFVFFESPNRLMPFDWHSNLLPFSEILPDRLLAHYVTRSSRWNIPNGFADETTMYRWGRGASFHEFDLAIGLGAFEVVADGYSPYARPQLYFRPHDALEAALHEVFDKQDPPIPHGFARPSLDLILHKP